MGRFRGHFVVLTLLAAIALVPAFPGAALLRAQGTAPKGQPQRTLDIYFIDTEGGQATLFVTPSGESMLVDTGFAGNQGMPDAAAKNSSGAPITRDADRIPDTKDACPDQAGPPRAELAGNGCPSPKK